MRLAYLLRSRRALTLGAFVVVASMASDARALDPFVNGTDALTNGTLSSGVAMGIADMNADGLDDIVRLNDANSLEIEYQQPDGTFTSLQVGNIENSWSLSVGDINNDGYPDVFVGGAYNGLKVLVANEDGTEYEFSGPGGELAGPPGGVFVQCSNFVDLDNDGALDLFVCDDDGLSDPFRGDGMGGMTWDTGLISAASTVPSDNSGNYGSIWTDFDNDGDVDLYLAKCRLFVDNPNDGRRTNLLFRNDGGGSWTEVAPAAGLQPLAQSWAADFGDIDNDGDFDVFLLNHDMPAQLYENQGPGDIGTFTDITSTAIGADITAVDEGINTHFADFDNDTFVDLLVTVSSGDHRLYMNNGDGTFTADLDAFPLGNQRIQSAVVGDLNDDGFMDVYAGFAFGFNSPSGTPDELLLNATNDNNWIGFRLEGVDSNRGAVGAKIELTGPWGTQIRELRAGEGYGITNSLLKIFGLGDATSFDTVTITWPSGQVDTFDYAEINVVHHVVEGCPEEFFADADGDGFGDADAAVTACVPPENHTVDGTDCADDDENNYPGNEEVCDGQDNNCDGEADEGLDDCMAGSSGTDGGSADTSGGPSDGTTGDSGGPATTMTPGDESAGDESSGGGPGADDDGDGGCGCRTDDSGPPAWSWLAMLLVFGVEASASMNETMRARDRLHLAAGLLVLLAPAAVAAAPTQPGELVNPLFTADSCDFCHMYPNPGPQAADPPFSPVQTWQGSLMANSARDPVFWAGVAVADVDDPGHTELCVRCHSPRAFLEGNGTATSMDALTPEQREGVECEFCHRVMEDVGVPRATPSTRSTTCSTGPTSRAAGHSTTPMAYPSRRIRGWPIHTSARHGFAAPATT